MTDPNDLVSKAWIQGYAAAAAEFARWPATMTVGRALSAAGLDYHALVAADVSPNDLAELLSHCPRTIRKKHGTK